MQTLRQRAILQKLVRMRGSPEARARLKKHNEEVRDWRGRCRRCGAELEGSLAELRGHTCGEPNPENT